MYYELSIIKAKRARVFYMIKKKHTPYHGSTQKKLELSAAEDPPGSRILLTISCWL
jgi:hypothetical protein